jgi:hypothetical protein
MTTYPISLDLNSAELPLASLHLDPNNPRFVGGGSKFVQAHRIDKEAVQEAVRQKLIRDFEIEKLRSSIEVNGYLPIDRIVVKEFKVGRHVVLEGNRRICAAKLVDRYAEDGTAISESVLRSLVRIPCLIYTGKEQDAAWIFQGLRHLSGVLQWPSYSKAKLLVEQLEREGLSYAELGRKFGTSALSARHWAFAYYGFKQAQESPEYPGVVDVRAFTHFQELFNKVNGAVRNWMNWDENDLEFKDKARFNEFIGWLYPKREGNNDGSSRWNFDSRHLPRGIDIRDVSNLIRDDPKTFNTFKRERDIDKARSSARTHRNGKNGKASTDPLEEVFDAVRLCTRLLKNNPYRLAKDERSKTRLRKELDGLREAIAAISDDGENDEAPIVRR